MTFLKVLAGVGINLLIPLLAVALFLRLRRRMADRDVPSPPVLPFLWLTIAAMGWLMVLLTFKFWKWTWPASAGLFFLIYLAPFLTAKAALLLRGSRRLSSFHRVAFQGSVGYSALMATVVLGLMVAALQRPWTLYREISYGPDPEQVMDILVPRTAKVSPTIILLHGGGFIAGDKLDLAEVARQLARQGFTVANVNYRLATQAKNQYPTAVDDVQTAVAFLRDHGAQYKVDGRRMVAFGTSAGANLAIELGLAGQVQAVIDFYGPTNFMDQRFLDDFYNGEQNNEIALTYLGASLMDDSPLYYDASPLDMVSAHMPPTMIFHGARDNVVPLGQSLDFHKRLQQLGVTSRLQIEKDLGHGFLTVHGRSPQPYLNECGQFVHDVMPDAKM